MSGETSSSSLGCIYNCPLALNDHHSGVRGLEPRDAYARIKRNVQASLDCIVGTMPVHHFIDNFLPDIPPDRTKEILSSRGAFSAVPSSSATPSAIYEPLVSSFPLYISGY